MQLGGPPRAPPRGQPPPGSRGTRGHRSPSFQQKKSWGLFLVKDCDQHGSPAAKGGPPPTQTGTSAQSLGRSSQRSPRLHFQGLSPSPSHGSSSKRAPHHQDHRSPSPAPPRSPAPKRAPHHQDHRSPAPAPPRSPAPKRAPHHHDHRSPSSAPSRSPAPKRAPHHQDHRSFSPAPPRSPSPKRAPHHHDHRSPSPAPSRSPAPKRAPHQDHRSPSPGRPLFAAARSHAPQVSAPPSGCPAQAPEKLYPARWCSTSSELLPGQRAGKMAAPMELYCWAGGWGLPSVDLESLVVLTYARFTGAPLKVHKITNPWRSPSGTLPALRTSDAGVISQPHKIITHLRKQKYNADYDLSARQGADTLAFMSLLEEKLLPVLIHTFWVDAKNYVELTRKWYAEAMPFPLNLFLPGRMQKKYLERLQLLCGEQRPMEEEEVEKELYREARECLTLLSQRLGSQKFFFGDSPASLDAFVFSYVALLLQAKLPNGKLQAHVRGLSNLCAYCTHILSLYFPWDGAEAPPPRPAPSTSETDEEPYRRKEQILSVLAGLAAMVGYALFSGIVSIQRAAPTRTSGTKALGMAEEEEDE
ncbi:metaxin-1 isoform X2 [Notamacropus eugenii]|uniref:metaxin-1 isoform X2 n=1 Tax=Notamacropus eugenii TaxID=9315 RepID=UPI003B682622